MNDAEAEAYEAGMEALRVLEELLPDGSTNINCPRADRDARGITFYDVQADLPDGSQFYRSRLVWRRSRA